MTEQQKHQQENATTTILNTLIYSLKIKAFFFVCVWFVPFSALPKPRMGSQGKFQSEGGSNNQRAWRFC